MKKASETKTKSLHSIFIKMLEHTSNQGKPIEETKDITETSVYKVLKAFKLEEYAKV